MLDKWQLALLIASDRRLSRADVATALHLINFYSVEYGKAWPSYDTLAARTGAHRSSVIRSVKRLIATGYLTLLAKGGRSASNAYRPNFDAVVSRDGVASAPPHHDTPDIGAPPHSNSSTEATAEGASAQPNPTYHPGYQAGEEEEEPPPPPQSGAADALDTARASPSGSGFGQEFEAFWHAYPKHEDRRGAIREFTRIVQTGEATSDEVVAGAVRYAAWVRAARREPQWIKAPRNWLKNQDWVDAYDLPEPRPTRDARERKSRKDLPATGAPDAVDPTGSTIPGGVYVGQIVRSGSRLDANETEESLWAEIEVLAGAHQGTGVTDDMRVHARDATIREAAGRRLSALLAATGNPQTRDLSELHHRAFNFHVEISKTGRGPVAVIVTAYEPASPAFLNRQEQRRRAEEEAARAARWEAMAVVRRDPLSASSQAFGALVRELRERQGWSRARLAIEMDMDECMAEAIEEVEDGVMDAGSNDRLAILKALGEGPETSETPSHSSKED